MWPIVSTPLALVGLAALPALVAIYYLRNTPRRVVVSSLRLWVEPKLAPEGGNRFQRLRTPLLFWLELLALLLLALAAAGLQFEGAVHHRPLIVVLDDCFSMSGGEPRSPRQLAAEALLEHLRKTDRGSVRLVLAGEQPQLLGEKSHTPSEVERVLKVWKCESPHPSLDAAIAFATELGAGHATVLVLSDRPPKTDAAASRILWWSFGTARSNWAFVNASRATGPRGDRVLLEVENLAHESRTTTMRIRAGDPPTELKSSELRLGAFETERVVLELPRSESSPPLQASLAEDELSFDNEVTLLSPATRQIRCRVRLADREFQSLVERALASTGSVVLSDVRPHLVFSDTELNEPETSESWSVQVLKETDAEPYTGPFVLDRSHPLTDGLSLKGVIWGAGKTQLKGTPVVMAGNVTLLADAETATGRHEIQLKLRTDLSNFTREPAWPSLVWNLVEWRKGALPGLDRKNVRLGEEVRWSLPETVDSVVVTPPHGEARTLVGRRTVIVRANKPGVYRLKAGALTEECASNPLSRSASDLTGCATGRWGQEDESTDSGFEYRDHTRVLVLVVLGVLTLHLFTQSKSRW